MNWTRGLTRLWVFVSLGWGVYVFCLTWGDAGGICRNAMHWNQAADCSRFYFDAVWFGALIGAGGAVPLYIVGAGLVWIMRGFRQTEPQA